MKTFFQFALNPETKQTVFVMGFEDDLFIAYDCENPFAGGKLPAEVEKKSYSELRIELAMEERAKPEAVAFELLRRRIPATTQP